MSEESSIWEIRLGMYTTRRQAEEIKENIARLLRPDPDHVPPCPTPWSMSVFQGPDRGDLGTYPELIEQVRAESRLPP